ncbi:MAG: hypothetical protein NC250_01055 [Alistipes senegalensis]|nr:hypothetical protein [Bacteroides cellulosilyticus]MCM1351309.1 hypothetical protein [Alistipes senegalensis]
MDENIKIAQMRGTIFLPVNIEYNPELANIFKNLLPESTAHSAIMGNGIPIFMPTNTPPQWGKPWTLQLSDTNIMFLPGKIDIIKNSEFPYNDVKVKEFANLCVTWINTITTELQKIYSIPIKPSRIAYAPLFVLKLDECPELITNVWNKVFNITTQDHAITDRNVSFLRKKEIQLNEKRVQLNLLHTISEGKQTINSNGSLINKNVSIIQLDINTIPEVSYQLESLDVQAFFNEVLPLGKNLIENLIK